MKYKLVFPGEPSELKDLSMLDLDSFILKMMEDKQYIPPLRVLFVGNDCQFNDFVKLYVTKVL